MNKHTTAPRLTDYEADYHAWTVEQAALLRAGKLDHIDREHLAEEIEGLGRSEKREIESRLTGLLMHLLKWQYQPERRKGGWEASIRLQRKDLKKVIAENPSLRDYPAQELADAYTRARLEAEKETGIDFSAFPAACPYEIAAILDDGFLPE